MPSILSLAGIVLATLSALLAIAAVAYAQIHRFPHSPDALQDVSNGTGAFTVSNRFWNWRYIALVRADFRRGDARILDVSGCE